MTDQLPSPQTPGQSPNETPRLADALADAGPAAKRLLGAYIAQKAHDDSEWTEMIHDNVQKTAELQAVQDRLRHDEMTGLLNRQGFMEVVESADAKKTPYGIVAIDLDHFKDAVNDTHGHQYGDEVLTRVGDKVAGTLRINRPTHPDYVSIPAYTSEEAAEENGHAARTGGDEYLVFVDLTPREQLRANHQQDNRNLSPKERMETVVSRLRKNIASLAEEDPRIAAAAKKGFRAAIGFAIHEPDSTGAETIHLADQKMYQDKQHAR